MKTKNIFFALLMTMSCYGKPPKLTELGEAINNGKINLIKKIIKNDPERVNDSAYIEIKQPLLNEAIYALVMIKISQENDEESDEDDTSKRIHTRIIELLLKNNAPSNTPGQSGKTPLQLASENGLTEVVTLLLKHNVNVNQQTDITTGWFLGEKTIEQKTKAVTALHLAAMNKHPEIVTLLLDHGANPTIKNGDGKTAYDLIIEKLLIKNNDENLKAIKTALEQATYFIKKTTEPGLRGKPLENIEFTFK